MKNQRIDVTVLNWEKYNPPSDRTRHKHWFRINQNSAMSAALFELSAEQCWVWIQILAECCRKNTGSVTVLSQRFALISKVTEETVIKTIEILERNGTLSVSCQSTVSQLTKNRVHEHTNEHTNSNTTHVLSSGLELAIANPPVTENLRKGVLSTSSFEQVVFSEIAPRLDTVLYPNSEFLKREARKMCKWLLDNKHKTPKSKSGWSRFVNGWLERGWERERKVIQSNKPSDAENNLPNLDELMGESKNA